MSGVIRPQQLADQVIRLLKEAIGSAEYPVGAKLPPEPQLCKELRVGRSTLREAVRALAHQGVLEVRQGDGTYVRSLPRDGEALTHRLRRAKVSEIVEARRALELEIVRLAAERHDGKDIENIRSFLEIRQQALDRGDSDGALDADIAFHCAIAWATHNEVFADIYRTFAITLRHALAALWETKDGAPSQTRELHAQLVEAIGGRDTQKAVAIASVLLAGHEAAIALTEKDASREKQ